MNSGTVATKNAITNARPATGLQRRTPSLASTTIPTP